MKTLQLVAVGVFVGGIALFAGALAFRGDGSTNASPAATRTDVIATPTNVPTQAPTAQATPTPTPTPFDGRVARMKIPRFRVDSAIEPIGILPTNELDTPRDPLNTGWYDIYDKPGFGGNAVFSAHVDYYPNIIGPFNKLAEAALNDEVLVVMENGLEYKYRVISNRRYDVKTIPMGDIIWPQNRPANREWITLITCGGQFVSSRPGGPGEYLHRDVVVAERIQ